jgi:hypothetical protein
MRLFYLALLTSLLLLSGCHAETSTQPPKGWKTECVGRYEVALPENIEVALTDPEGMDNRNAFPNRYHFSDGTSAAYSGGYDVSPKITEAQFTQFQQHYDTYQKNLKLKLIQEGNKTDEDYLQSLRLPGFPLSSFAWGTPNYIDFFYYANERVFHFYAQDNKLIKAKISPPFSFHPRPLFTAPQKQGVCFPYGFIADNGNDPYSIGITVRPIDHPDVEIMVSISHAQHFDKGNSPSLLKKLAKNTVESFWDYKYSAVAHKSVDTDWTHTISIDGRDGYSKFASYENYTKNDPIPNLMYKPQIYTAKNDFGFIAKVEGDDSNVTKPTIEMYVIRTADRAKGKPVTESELKEIANTVLQSIRPRNIAQ